MFTDLVPFAYSMVLVAAVVTLALVCMKKFPLVSEEGYKEFKKREEMAKEGQKQRESEALDTIEAWTKEQRDLLANRKLSGGTTK